MNIYWLNLSFIALVSPVILVSGAAVAGQGEQLKPIVSELELSSDSKQKQAQDDNGCIAERASEEWVDGLRAETHSRLCNTAGWLDGLFGDDEEFDGEKFTGKLSIGFKQDEIDGLDPRIRVRINAELPNVSKRLKAFVGRVEEDSYIANTEVNEDRLNNVGLRSTNDEDSEWLVGLGYRAPNEDSNGFDVSVGAKLSSGVSPYAKLAYRYMFRVADDKFLRTTQTAFWRKQDGFGISSSTEFTKLIGDNDIWVTHGSAKYTEEAEQIEWFADTAWHHSLSDKRGISSSIYVRGEEENPVSVPEYGITLTYICPILRDWLFMETGLDLRWEKDQPGQSYKSAVQFGLQFEMLLGDYYQRRKYR
ncbi:MAG: hypothetical protein JKX81_06930 [Arenicella sp.]|nr:hypothetical protein [Arenicella sp.]